VFERYREIQMRRVDEGSSERGFTLIELLIVIVVLGILAAIVVFSLTGVTGQSKAAACNANGKTIEVAANAYTAATGSYPANVAALVGTGTGTQNSYLQTTPSMAGVAFTLDTTNQTVDVAIGTGAATAYTASGGCDSL
jgi:general secretion pathway protein G